MTEWTHCSTPLVREEGREVRRYYPLHDRSCTRSQRAGDNVVERSRRGLVLVLLDNKEAVSGTRARVIMNALGLISSV